MTGGVWHYLDFWQWHKWHVKLINPYPHTRHVAAETAGFDLQTLHSHKNRHSSCSSKAAMKRDFSGQKVAPKQ